MSETETRTANGWIVTITEVVYGQYTYTASRGKQFYTGMVAADSIDSAMSKAIEAAK